VEVTSFSSIMHRRGEESCRASHRRTGSATGIRDEPDPRVAPWDGLAPAGGRGGM